MYVCKFFYFRHVFGEEEPDTGPLEDENCLTIKELSSSMPDAEDVQELLKDKGGFLDQAWLALKYLYNKVGDDSSV